MIKLNGMKKESKVVMLPTEKASYIHLVPIKDSIGINCEEIDGKLIPLKKPKLLYTEEKTEFGFPPQHLYFLSDDEIKERDWFIRLFDNVVLQANSQTDHKVYDCKKIIATTDESLKLHDNSGKNHCFGTQLSGNCKHILPRPSNEFLKKFCELGGIDKVLVEYVEYPNKIGSCSNGEGFINGTKQYIKVAPDNTISIYSIE